MIIEYVFRFAGTNGLPLYCLDHVRVAMASPNGDSEILFAKLPADMEHRIHEFLRVAEVCALRRVSHSWHTRTREALQQTYRWDVVHVEGVDAAPHVWLEHVSKAGVNIRSLDLREVRIWRMKYTSFSLKLVVFFWFLFFDVGS